ncbi:hypothetical protein COC42_00100 [Sphingomonas spermidinifaciens]|uniref:Uncharacterized protein n=1 Tax=Sphingomonas spermidinifaciens TaxID=1141889 RepID=A0A2A4B129_9SPHN|nr:hypothetical protein [Sphingomonas spermidinifaciens]PCD02893.1 hypothetical protein COC42_00100 [Sphingomonas spermidinifaciens]
MIAAMILAAQVTPSDAVAAYADCLSSRINADPAMIDPPADVAARLAIHDAALKTCAAKRKSSRPEDAAMFDRVDASTRKVLEDPVAAEQDDGDLADAPKP